MKSTYPLSSKGYGRADARANMFGQNSLMNSLDRQAYNNVWLVHTLCPWKEMVGSVVMASTYPLSLEGDGGVGGDGETGQGLGGGMFPRVRVTIQRHRQQHLDTRDKEYVIAKGYSEILTLS